MLRPTRQLKKLGEIAKTQSGGTPSRSNSTLWGGDIIRLKSGELNDNTHITEYSETITQEGVENSSAKLFPKGTLLIAMYGATAGKLGILGVNATTNQAICSIQNTKGLFDSKYIFYVLLQKRDQIIKDSFGGAQPNISKTYLDNLQISLPPLEEQKKIVAYLDELNATITKLKAEYQSQLTALDEMRNSSLDLVFGGSREGDLNNWKSVKLGDVAELGPKKSQISSMSDNLEISFVPMADLSQETPLFDPKEIRTLGEVRKGYTYFQDNDVLLAKVTPCFENGKCGIAKNLKNGIGFGSSEFFVFRMTKIILPEYFYYFVSSKSFRKEGEKNMGGAVGLQRVKQDRLKNIEIPVPDLATQARIIAHLDQVHEHITALKAQVNQQIQHCDELWQSSLEQVLSQGLK